MRPSAGAFPSRKFMRSPRSTMVSCTSLQTCAAHGDRRLREGTLTEEAVSAGQAHGLSRYASSSSFRAARSPSAPASLSYKMVDTCAAEFAAETPYFYAAYDEENEAAAFLASRQSGKKPWSSCSAPAPSASARASSSTMPRCTACGRCKKRGLRGGDRQQQPRNRLHGLRHRRPAVF